MSTFRAFNLSILHLRYSPFFLYYLKYDKYLLSLYSHLTFSSSSSLIFRFLVHIHFLDIKTLYTFLLKLQYHQYPTYIQYFPIFCRVRIVPFIVNHSSQLDFISDMRFYFHRYFQLFLTILSLFLYHIFLNFNFHF